MIGVFTACSKCTKERNERCHSTCSEYISEAIFGKAVMVEVQKKKKLEEAAVKSELKRKKIAYSESKNGRKQKQY